MSSNIKLDSHILVNDQAILIREGSSAQPLLFFVHDDIGSLTYASRLASHLSPEMTLYGLSVDVSALEGRSTLQEMASRMVIMIRNLQPLGPYRLAGYSLGGILAYEIAAQLLGEDQFVEFIGLLNSVYTFSSERPSSDKIIERLAQCYDESLSPPTIIATEIEKALTISRALTEAINHYRPQAVQSPVFLFRPEKNVEKSDFYCGWNHSLSAKSLRIIQVPGTSGSMMHVPNVTFLGQAMSEAIRESGATKHRRVEQQYIPLVTLQTGISGGTPLLCVPGAGATVVSFTDLIGRLSRDWRVFGLQPQGTDGLSIPHMSLAAAATCYIKAIQGIYSDGPLHLLGHSYGGWAVFEVACRLISTGRKVASVTVIDSMVPSSGLSPVRGYTHGQVLQHWVDIFEMLLDRPLGICMKDLESLSLDDQLVRIHERLLHLRFLPKNSIPDALRGPFHTFAAAMRSQFTPKYTLHGAVHLIIVDDSKLDDISNHHANEKTIEGWRQWAPDLQVFHAPSNHMTILKKPHVNAVGDWLYGKIQSRCFVSAQRRA